MLILAAASEINWEKLFNPGVMVFLIGGLIAIVAIISTAWLKVVAERERARLKADMIERGYSAQEIVSVIEAGHNITPDEQDTPTPDATRVSRDAETMVSKQ